MTFRRAFWFGLLCVSLSGCTSSDGDQPVENAKARQEQSQVTKTVLEIDVPSESHIQWAVAIHGGAGKPPQGLPPEELADYEQSVSARLVRALTVGKDMLADQGTALDVVERVVRMLEDDPNFNAGRGSVLNIEGGFELHASIMDGRTRDCGAVAAVDTIANPISAARLVMSHTDFVLLVGEGAERFAVERGIEAVGADYFRTELRHQNWLKARRALDGSKTGQIGNPHSGTDDMAGTVGCVALDRHGNLAAATSTGGVAHKRFGRMGDSSIIGAGNYADNRTCAVSCTGIGEHFIRNTVAFHVHSLMRYKDWSLDRAVRHVIDEELEDSTGGLIAVDGLGNILTHFNREGMRRAVADSAGRFQVNYWD